jgi:hypothetical protein
MVVLTSTANDQGSEFALEFQSLTLTSQTGKTVNPPLDAQQPSEFIHLNGAIDPLITATVPQDVWMFGMFALRRQQPLPMACSSASRTVAWMG